MPLFKLILHDLALNHSPLSVLIRFAAIIGQVVIWVIVLLVMSDQVQDLRRRLAQAEDEYENYKVQCKELEQMLEEESQQKEQEIIELKNQAIMKDKELKMVKTEVAQLRQETTVLQQQLSESNANASAAPVDNSALEQLQAKYEAVVDEKKSLEEKLGGLEQTNQDLTNSNKKLLASHSELVAKAADHTIKSDVKAEQVKGFEEERKKWEKQVEELKKKVKESGDEANVLKKKLDEALAASEKQKEKGLNRQNSGKKELKVKPDAIIDKEKYEQRIRKLQQTAVKADKLIKQYRFKLESVSEENHALQARLNDTTLNLTSSPIHMKSVQDEAEAGFHYSCLLLTKPHYVSPFLEIYEDKGLIKIYKSSRSGTFEKSMGSYRHRFDHIAYDQNQLLEPLANAISESHEQNHAVFFYGPTRTSKKQLLSKFVGHLQSFILEKLDSSEGVSGMYIQRGPDESKNLTIGGEGKNAVLEAVEAAVSVTKEKGVSSPKKGAAKGCVRYLRVTGESWQIEVGTSSYTGVNLREKMSPSAMLNHILYSKLPDVLQSTLAHKHLVLTLNPIVSLYEETKHTLAATLCKAKDHDIQQDSILAREEGTEVAKKDLNSATKKKLEAIERESEQTSLRIRRLEDECGFYRSRFEELELRLKNLLSTHSNQNVYLKKSPVTLSYEKLLKFVHSVQGRNGMTSSVHMVHSASKDNIVIGDNESIDAL